MRTVRLIKNISRFSIGFTGTLSLACMTFSGVHAQELQAPSDQPSNSAANISKVVTKDQLITEKQKASELFTVAHAQPAQPADQGTIAQNTGVEKKEADKKEVEKPNRFTLSADFFHRHYKEEAIEPGFQSEESGNLIGGQADYDYIKGDSVYFGASLRYAGGKTSYDGSFGFVLPGGGELGPYIGTGDNRFLNINARIGYTFKLGTEDRLLLTPFVGVGYNKWERDTEVAISPFGPFTSTSFSDYSWTTVDLGLKSEYKLSPKFDIGLNLKVLFPGNGRVSTVESSLTDRTQYEIELPLTYHLTESSIDAFDIKLTPYYRSQDFGRSGVGRAVGFGGFGIEPNSTTEVSGVTLGIVYRFQPIGPGATASATPAVPSKAKDSLRYK
jgi:hypothetical protein